jgi:23S rRNA pseudouridine1911/1915/1917 synthase
MPTITIPDGITNERCDKVLSQQCHLSRSMIKASFKQNPFLRNGKMISIHEKVNSGDIISFKIDDTFTFSPRTNINFTLNIIFEDEDVIIINKPAGIIIHPGPGIQEKTLIEYVSEHCLLSTFGQQGRSGVIHRLDKDTTGVIIFTKSDLAFTHLVADFAHHRIEKRYTCIIHGTPDLNTGKIEIPIARRTADKSKMIACPSGKSAKTTWSIHKRFTYFTWLDIKIHTGRTHQIRVHMRYIGHPIAGDKLYGYNGDIFFPRVMLHAESIIFTHPRTKERLCFTVPLPQDFSEAVVHLSNVEK